MTKQTVSPSTTTYPAALNSAAKRALYDNLGKDEALALAVDGEIRLVKKDGFRGNKIKEREVRNAIGKHVKDEAIAAQIFNIVVSQHEY